MAKILIVDDSADLRSKLKGVLESDGHQVLEAQDGLQGLELYKAGLGIELVICDLNMPIMDGLKLCRLLNLENLAEKIPLVMLTTETNPEIKEEAKNYGVLAWVTKPFVAQSFLMGINKLLAKYGRKPAKNY